LAIALSQSSGERIAVDSQLNRRRTLVALVAVLAAASLGVGAVSLALFTSTATVPANAFSTGTLVLTTSPASALVTFANMAPGDQVTAPITVTNGGSLDLRYSISSVATNADLKGLKDQLVLTVKSGVATCTDAGFGATGTVEYAGDLDSAAGRIVGDPATGADPGDRPLAASAGEVLCFNVSLPASTGSAFQAATTTATFTFDAEQTKNN
jgi:predicted ribosomally synthesized peptide with SipW-like signal peptide